MNVLTYAERYYPHIGGIETVSRNIVEYLAGVGANVRVVTRYESDIPDPPAYSIVRNPSRDKLKRLVDEADIVHMHSFEGYLFFLALLKRKIVIMSYHDVTMICPRGVKWRMNEPCMVEASLGNCLPCLVADKRGKVVRRLLRPMIKSLLSLLVDANICMSPYATRKYRLAKKREILSGIDTTLFRPPEKKAKNPAPVFLFVGRLIEGKGCQTLIEALGEIRKLGRETRLHVCGDGEYRAELENIARSFGMGGAVIFHGNVEGEELVSVIQQADICVVPSLFVEYFGLVAIEAMACGLPVIGVDDGGLGEIVRDVGLSFKRADVNDLKKQILKLLDRPEQISDLSARGREVVLKKYDLANTLEAHHKLMLDLLAGRKG